MRPCPEPERPRGCYARRAMSRSLEDEPAIVLRATAYGESDRVVTLLTERHGKVSALAKNARRSAKRFAGGLGLFTTGKAAFVDRPGAELARLERFDATMGWPGLLADLGKIAHAGYVAELLDGLLPARQADGVMYELALRFIRTLDAGEPSADLLRVFELALLEAVGLRPELTRCIGCGREADDAPGQRVDPSQGGLVCGRCRGAGPLVDGAARAYLVAAQAAAIEGPWPVAGAAAKASRAALQAILVAHLPRALKSVSFIEKLNESSTGSE